MNLRVLHPERDEKLFRDAWKWRESYPRLVRQWDAIRHFKPWFALMKRRVSVGIFTDHLIAIATLQPKGNGVYEAHIDCERRVDINALTIALLSIQAVVFNQWQATEIFVAAISRNGGTIRLAETCGYQRDGIEESIGRLRWIRMRITRDEFKEDSNPDRHAERTSDEHIYLRTTAGSRVSRHQHAA